MSENNKEHNTVFIGKKPFMNYVLAVTTQFSNGSDEVILKARGRAIGTAVDTAEIVRNRFMPGVTVKSINIGTEQVTREDGKKMSVSAIDIILKK